MTKILGLETSCDETAAAIVEDGWRVCANVVATQHKLHERYRGVVPEIASRAHLENISPVIHETLQKAGLELADVDAIAVGHRPGLIGSLLVGVSAAKALAWSLNKPLIGVDHVRAHLHAAVLQTEPTDEAEMEPIRFPALGLVVSGGHSNLYAMHNESELEPIGSTIDDAIGEAYDKAAVILDLGYPGGPRLDKLAQEGDSEAYELPRSMLGPDSLDFSFSGLKTAVLYTVRGHPIGRGKSARFERSADDLSDKQKADIAASFQQAAVDTVMLKLQRAIDFMADRGEKPRSLVIGGGVSANSLLRQRSIELGEILGLEVRIPEFAYCLDNAAMIAGLAYSAYQQGRFDGLDLPAMASGTL
ncbi:MAG: tRNA (adenosine(37)-N6)-threonylcarbamoyltransferase complex transferase subunit TsaD [Phycisphaeraceae bacterium]